MAPRYSARIVAWILLAAAIGGCTLPDATDPNIYPYQLAERQEVEAFMPVDLEGDGRDERIVTWRREGANSSPDAVVLATLDRRTIQQVNYAASVTDRVQALDLNSDGTLEIVVPLVRNDSLFLSIVSAEGRKQGQLFVTSGAPRTEPEGTLPWDPAVRYATMLDVTGDGRAELVVAVVTRYARLPRGVWVFSWPERQLLGQQVVGAMITGDQYASNFDDDGFIELFFTSAASDNGAVAGGLDDQHAYIGAFELRGTPRLEWTREMGDIWSAARAVKGDVDGDGVVDLLIYEWKQRGRATPVALQRINPSTGQVLRQRTFDQQIRDVATVDLNQDGRDEVLVVNGEGKVEALNGDLKTRPYQPAASGVQRITVLPDADADDVDEIILTAEQGSLLLDRDLHVKGFTPVKSGTWKTVRRGSGQAPYLYAQIGQRATLFQLTSNPLYLWHRYGPWGGWLLGGLGLAGMGWAGRVVYRRARQSREARDHMVATSNDGILVLGDAQIEAANPRACRLLAVSEAAPSYDRLSQQAPEVLRLVQEAAREGQSRARDVPTPGGSADTAHVTVTAIGSGDEERAATAGQWLVRIRAAEAADAGAYRAWGLMARRVAHDLNNPLTSMLLTLQRLQMEYRDRTPEVASDLDAYTVRIEERIEHLRRMTKNFMKFIGAETPTLVRTDVNAYLDEQTDLLRSGLPPDIQLRVNQDSGLPPVRIDAEQMQSALENLVANAVNAMPEGGQITVATRLERGLRLDADTPPRDYVELEVLDTGVGMDATVRERLFEPGFTTSDEGTGLGLAIVQKVVRDHDGHIHVESERGTGSAISLLLPVDRGGGEPSA